MSDFCNITQWHEAGFTGKGINVWVTEGYTSHSRSCRKRVLDAAPDANVILGRMTYGTKNGKVDFFNVIENNDGNEQPPVPLEEFLKKHNINVLSTSLSPSPYNKSSSIIGKYWIDIQKKYNLPIFCASGNDSSKNKSFATNVAWMVGALVERSGKLVRASYSNGGEGLDFAESVGWWSGTSSATPYLAGKCAVLLSRYNNMSFNDVYDYMKMNCQDFGDIGEDPLYGFGMFVFPDVNEKWTGKYDEVIIGSDESDVQVNPLNPLITTTKIIVNGVTKTVRRVMVENENYIRLRDFDEVLGVCKVDYDSKQNLPVVKNK